MEPKAERLSRSLSENFAEGDSALNLGEFKNSAHSKVYCKNYNLHVHVGVLECLIKIGVIPV